MEGVFSVHNSQEVANAIKVLAKEKKITVGKMLLECNLSINTLSSMQSGGYYPRIEAISKIADYLDCSVDFLLGRTDIPDINRKTKSIGLNFATYLENNDDEFDIAAKGKNLHTQKINRNGKTPKEIVKELNDSIENT